jgi:hypothetical protein
LVYRHFSEWAGILDHAFLKGTKRATLKSKTCFSSDLSYWFQNPALRFEIKVRITSQRTAVSKWPTNLDIQMYRPSKLWR